MKYFVTDNERENTNYHEFQKGHWDRETFWKDDSINLSDDVFCELKFMKLFIATIPDYDCYADSEIDKATWDNIKSEAEKLGGQIYECILEAYEWVKNTFLENDVFTIIGL